MTWLDPLQVRDPKDAYDDGFADGLAAQPDWPLGGSRLGAGDEDRSPAVGAPTPRLVELGTASWYDNGPGLYAAAPAYRGDPYTIQACGFEGGRTNCLTLLVVDRCACYVGTNRERIIDLSPAAFRSLAPLSKGLVRVTVERLAP